MKQSGYILAILPAMAFAHGTVLHAQTSDTAVPVSASLESKCDKGICHVSMTGDQVLARAEQLVAAKDYINAMPLIEILGKAPQFSMQHKFLKGFVAVESGDLKTAEVAFREILVDHPEQTRVRLELARVMVLMGKEASADYNFRLAEHDSDLPPGVAQTIRTARGILRDQRKWHFNVDIGLAPDTNINSATSAESININYGPFQLPSRLSEQARQKSGIGVTGGISAGLRLKMSDKLSLLIDSDTHIVNYKGTFADDLDTQLAVGPEFRIGKTASLSVQAVGDQRWVGWNSAKRDLGLQLGLQKVLDVGQRVGVSIDARKTWSQFSDAYSGNVFGGNATYERIIGRSFIASASIFGRRDDLESEALSNTVYGANIGIGGELPMGVNAGINASVATAHYGAPQYIYSFDKRHDLRFSSRIYMGIRSIKFQGFSPSVEYDFTKNNSNYTLYESVRHRVNFKLSRYF
jgi:outer membrane protein